MLRIWPQHRHTRWGSQEWRVRQQALNHTSGLYVAYLDLVSYVRFWEQSWGACKRASVSLCCGASRQAPNHKCRNPCLGVMVALASDEGCASKMTNSVRQLLKGHLLDWCHTAVETMRPWAVEGGSGSGLVGNLERTPIYIDLAGPQANAGDFHCLALAKSSALHC